MKIETLIKIMQGDVICYDENGAAFKLTDDDKEVIGNALEKQIAKKKVNAVDSTWGIEKEVPVCPVCDCYLDDIDFLGDGSCIAY